MSSAENDQLINDIVKQVYKITLFALLIVLLIISNNARLLGYAVKVTKLQEVDKREINHYLTNMQSSVMRLNDLVNDLLEVSRLDQNRLPITIQEIDAAEILKKIVDETLVMIRANSTG